MSGDIHPTVRNLRESPRDASLVVLTLSDDREFVVTLSAVADLGLGTSGRAVSAEAVERLQHEHEIGACLRRALHMMARARRTRRELQLRLRRLYPDRAIVAAALDRLEASGVLSDENAATAEAASRLRRGVGPAAIRRTLRGKGISQRTADDALSQAAEQEAYDELETCRLVAARRHMQLSSLPRDVQVRRLSAFLLRRGFSRPIAGQVLREVLSDTQNP